MSLCVDMHGHIPYDEQMTENPYSPFDQFTVYFYRNLNQEIVLVKSDKSSCFCH